MAELRWNPLLNTWTMVNANRQNRPHMPKDWCPFCPGSGKVPEHYDVYKYDNDFPVMSLNPPVPDEVGSEIYKAAESYGKCEVILYSPDHNTTLSQLSVEHISKLIDLWVERATELSQDPKIKYVFPFENKGAEVGVTMVHPHGQLYAYSFVPLKVEMELKNCQSYYNENNKCLICQMNEDEIKFKKRIIYQNQHFIAYLPFFTDYPYGVFIVSQTHKSSLLDLNDEEKRDLAEMLKIVTGSFDMIFDISFPYMLVVHHSPVNSEKYNDSDKYYHFHIEFYPPLREKDKIKFYASSEAGAFAAANVMPVEESAKKLNKAKLRYLAKWNRDYMVNELKNEFAIAYGYNQEAINVYSSPARVNLIGEHIDYNGGLVLPCAIDMYIYMAIRRRNDSQVIITDINMDDRISFDLTAELINNQGDWGNYPKGVIQTLIDKGHDINQGFEVLLFSEIPQGSGLSSSAALEVVFAYALNDIFNLGINNVDMSVLCQKAENEFVGVKCGIMDQFAVAMGKLNHAIKLNCNTLEYDYIPIELIDYKLVITHTNKKRELVDSKYNERLDECNKGLACLQKVVKIDNLCSLSEEDYALYENSIPDEIIRRRVKHVVSENERVKKAVNALKENDLTTFGKLLRESHLSLRDNYEVTGLELDTLFEYARSFNGCLTTRMTGAGFGGCTISLVNKDKIEEFKKYMEKHYKKETGLTPLFYVSEVGDGVKKLG